MEVTSSQVKLKKVVVGEWTEEDNYKVGGITGLLDGDQFLHLKLDLWESASRPPNNSKIKSELIEEDQSTWTWENLGKFAGPASSNQLRRTLTDNPNAADGEDIKKLAQLLRFAPRTYQRTVEQPINLLKIVGCCENINPIGEYIKAEDKHDLSQSSNKVVVFNLDVKAFDQGNRKNSAKNLAALKEELCPGMGDDEQFMSLQSSPISNVTVTEATKVRAGIPASAMFYCFCYPRLGTNPKTSQADDSDPFVCLLRYGGFLYFDHTYDIVAANAVYFNEVEDGNPSGKRFSKDSSMIRVYRICARALTCKNFCQPFFSAGPRVFPN